MSFTCDVEPKWDSCDGRQATFGWDNVILQIHFESRTPTIALVEHADGTLHRLGWSHEYDRSGQVGWTKQLANGSVCAGPRVFRPAFQTRGSRHNRGIDTLPRVPGPDPVV